MSNKKRCKCTECEIPIWKGSTKCRECFAKTKRGENYEENKLKKLNPVKKRQKQEPRFCLDCNKSISKSSLRCKSCAQKGILNHFAGKVHTKQTCDIISASNKGRWAGDKNPRVTNPLNGDLNPNWQGGISYDKIYPYVFKKKMRPWILNTYPCCQWCASEKDLVVHHIDHNIRNNEFCNLITLCRSCNSKEMFDLKILKFYYFRRITENLCQYLGGTDPLIENLYPGSNPKVYKYFKDMEKNPIANQNKEWGVIIPRN